MLFNKHFWPCIYLFVNTDSKCHCCVLCLFLWWNKLFAYTDSGLWISVFITSAGLKYKFFQHYNSSLSIFLQIIGIVFAIQTRKVKVKVLNDAKWVAAIIYSSSLCVIVIILSKFTLTGFLNFGTSLMNIAVILATSLILTLAFVPKVLFLHI